jgi:hypothetical protein
MEDGDIHLNYLSKGSIKKEELSVGEYRWIFSRQTLTIYPDNHKSAQALPANVIQGCDAEMARYITKRMRTFSIHDSFGVNLIEIHHLMDLTNKYFDIKMKKKYGMFILI